MIKYSMYFLVVFLMSGWMYKEATSMYNDCGPVREMQIAQYKSGMAYVATGIDSRFANPVQLFINTKDKTFVVLGMDYDMNACVLFKGFNWTPIFETN